METIRSILDPLDDISNVLVVIAIIAGVVLWLRGIVPVLYRLGNGLSRRKIAIFAKGDMATSLVDLLCDSKLFKKKNVLKVSSVGDMGRAEGVTLFLVYWPDWREEIDKVLELKADGTALIVYAPQEQGFIPKETMALLDKKRNVVVNNFRGRLLNDIVASMITTSYEKK